ncbi:cobyric acid synthase [Pacificibacter marinus]|uniref:Cobyric acid synthase n=1 Tax=Pacificibacter marinus TaxID=658057 RepID=A0A1Y5SV22_9RHOB|nr:cobyric acid synthase [Pacificibacter marinus]SEK65931.1 adenosylcobyric acid synthase (glutamine-hydrolysing) [Pacificibacter marinus]SLN47147.1 Cobyric acid synthase [Pacificibacter marinus]
MTKAIMIQGAGSNVGKSMLVAGIARALTQRGYTVAPFKPQNMSNNAAVTSDGGEIGRAQALQARACGLKPHTDMNPVLLKPESDVGAQVVVHGKRVATMKARDYGKMKSTLMPAVLQSFQRLAANVDFIIIEGAGSPAEINLRHGDIANMGFAEAANVPVILIGDIDRGGVIAQIVGTHTVLPPQDRDRIKAFAVNKFRGDVSLFSDGAKAIVDHTGWTDLGTIPWFSEAHKLPAEDIMDIASSGTGHIKIAVPRLSRIANFDDLDPLASEPNVTIEIVEAGHPLPADATLILLPGTKSTIADLAYLRAQGWDIDIMSHVRRGGHVLGICGGYQMLGTWIDDLDGLEGIAGRHAGLGLLDVTTEMTDDKRLAEITATDTATGTTFNAYEIHIGQTNGPDCEQAWLEVEGRLEGAQSASKRIKGCYLHGLFASDAFRHGYLAQFGLTDRLDDFEYDIDKTLDALAMHMESHIDINQLIALAGDV